MYHPFTNEDDLQPDCFDTCDQIFDERSDTMEEGKSTMLSVC